MLALLLGIVLAYELCDKVDSCTLQVNGTRPRASIIATLPNGGVGHTFTTTDCIRGLIGITEPCQCQNSTSWSNPGFCYFSGNYSQTSSTDSRQFCKNQDGINTFSMWNISIPSHGWPWYCHCFDPITGTKNTASFDKPVCKAGQALYMPCSTDGKNDNAALLAKYTGKEAAALNHMGISRTSHYRTCQCEHNTCAANENRHYCQSDIGVCTEDPSCEVDKVFAPTKDDAQGQRMSRAGASNLNLDKFQEHCQCGYYSCGVGEMCQTEVIDGFKKYVCTYNGGSSSVSLMIKQFHGAMGLAFVFSLIAFVCLIVVIVFWILTCLKVNRAAKLATTNVESQ